MYIVICKKTNKKGKCEKEKRGPCDRPVLKKQKKKTPFPCWAPHSMTSLGATVTSCKGISWLPTWSWVVAVWRMSVVPSVVMTVSVVGGDVTVMPFLFWWVFICLARWSLLMNLLEHSEHTNFFSPVSGENAETSDCEAQLWPPAFTDPTSHYAQAKLSGSRCWHDVQPEGRVAPVSVSACFSQNPISN